MPAKPAALLSPEFLAQIERLSLHARRPVRGWTAGQRRSRRSGHSVEFADYRPYGMGDDLRYVDWNIYGRTERMVVKLFVDDEELCLHLLVDASGSMDWGEPSKLEWAKRMAAALGFIGLAGLERVGIGVMRDQVTEGWPPARGRGHIPPLMDLLAKVKGEGATHLNAALAQYARALRGRGLMILISDLLDPEGYEAGLRAVLESGFEVHVIHVLSPDELEPSLEGDLRLLDAETGEARILRVDAEALAGYRERLRRFLDGVESFCRQNAIGYHRTSTATPVEGTVLGPLRGRLIT
jgi:uncharacterized protein (DUF58 family)